MKHSTLARLTGYSYILIFFLAIFANFFVLEALTSDPVNTVQQNPLMVRSGIMAFMLTVVFDVVVAWTLLVLYRQHPLTLLSTFFRMMHATIMGVGLFVLPLVFKSGDENQILGHVEVFNTIWLIGLFFFGIHLILLSSIMHRPKWITVFLGLAGCMYMVDTTAHILMSDYESWAGLFLVLVALPSVIGEMSFALWMLIKGPDHIKSNQDEKNI